MVSSGESPLPDGWLERSEGSKNQSTNDTRKLARDRVADLADDARSGTFKIVVVGKALQPGHFTKREVAMASIVKNQDVLTTRNTVHPSLDRFGRPVQLATAMTIVQAGAGNQPVIVIGFLLFQRLRQTRQGITHSSPRLEMIT